MSIINVKLKNVRDDSYSIIVKPGILSEVPGIIAKKWKHISKWAIVTDSNVMDLDSVLAFERMCDKVLGTSVISFKAGEKSKNRNVSAQIENKLFEYKLGRDGGIIALGGGVTGDMAGFVAATYMRGIPFVQIPTTLLAMVDSSVGGKTGVNVPAGKNLVGAFHQPIAVFIDPKLLYSLRKTELANGFAEIVKHAVIRDAALFKYLENNVKKILDLDEKVMAAVIAKNCCIKAAVVEKDERESGLRQILNYGHTVGHAIEKLSNYKISHGNAVSIGMAIEGKIANTMGIFPATALHRQNELLKAFNLPISTPKGLNISSISNIMIGDKKSRGGKIKMALPTAIGKMSYGDGTWVVEPPTKIVEQVLSLSRQAP